MRKVFGIIPLLLVTLLANANPIDKAWEECAKIEKQIKKHPFLNARS